MNNSPSLIDVESANNELITESEESHSEPNTDAEKTEENKPIESIEASTPNENVSNAELIQAVSPKIEESDTNKIEDVNNVTPKNSSRTQSVCGSGHKSVLAVHLGTPILKSNSPYRKLPNSEKFSKDICDVINFENLPDSTGKYDQMSELLQKVRSTILELHKE
jgi:zinc finger CCHC domain-containing protein 8